MLKFAALVMTVLSASGIWAQSHQATPPLVQILVQPHAGADARTVEQSIRSAGAQLHHTINQLNVHVLQVPEPALQRVTDALSKTGLFTFVERDLKAYPVTTPNDPYFGSQWHLTQISAPSAWDLTTGSSNVTIGIIDSGMDSTHPDLSPKAVAGWNFINGNSNTSDTMGHGTQVAGTAAAATNNGTGVSGVGWSNPVMPLVVVDSTGSAYYSNMASAITYAADHGVRIVNMSLAGTGGSSTLQSAITYAWNKGTVVFAAAGNYSTSTPYYPAACDYAVAVSSTSSSDTLSSFSNYGSWIDVAAPGESILTTASGGGYTTASGTSFSAPITAGVAALMLSKNPSLSASTLVSVLEQNADDLGPAGFDTSFGWGRVNAYRAVSGAAASAADTVPPAVSITSPAAGTVGGSVMVQGTATDNTGVVRVELWIDGALSTSTTSAAFSFNWNSTTVANGSHTLTVKAYDASNNVGQASVTVNVSNVVASPSPDTKPPTISITSPLSGTRVSTNVKITVSASDNVGVTQVTIYVDGVMVYSGTAAPYTYNWNTKKAASGSHTITATAWDAAGNSASATPVTVSK